MICLEHKKFCRWKVVGNTERRLRQRWWWWFCCLLVLFVVVANAVAWSWTFVQPATTRNSLTSSSLPFAPITDAQRPIHITSNLIQFSLSNYIQPFLRIAIMPSDSNDIAASRMSRWNFKRDARIKKPVIKKKQKK